MATSTAGTITSTRFEAVEGLRALAALAIVAFHLALNSVQNETALRFLYHLEVGVPVFFVITGFVLFRPWVVARHEQRQRPRVGRFARRRAARIVPAYWLTLTAALILGVERGDAADHPLPFFAFAQVYSPEDLFDGLQVAWSLDVEVVFYGLLPLLALVCAGLGAGRLAALAAAGVAAVLAFRGVAAQGDDFWVTFTLLGTIDWFLLGMALAAASVTAPALLRRVDPLAAAGGALGLLALTGILGLPWGAGGNYTPAGWAAQHLLYGAIALLAVLSATAAEARDRSPLRSLLRSRPLTWLGRISFGIFLWHMPILIGYRKLFAEPGELVSPVALAAWTLALTIPVAAASWYAVERPALRSRFAR